MDGPSFREVGSRVQLTAFLPGLLCRFSQPGAAVLLEDAGTFLSPKTDCDPQLANSINTLLCGPFLALIPTSLFVLSDTDQLLPVLEEIQSQTRSKSLTVLQLRNIILS